MSNHKTSNEYEGHSELVQSFPESSKENSDSVLFEDSAARTRVFEWRVFKGRNPNVVSLNQGVVNLNQDARSLNQYAVSLKQDVNLNQDGGNLNQNVTSLNQNTVNLSHQDGKNLNQDSENLNQHAANFSQDAVNLRKDGGNLNQQAVNLNQNVVKLNHDTSNLNQDARNLGKQDALNLNQNAAKLSKNFLNLNQESSNLNQDARNLNQDARNLGKQDGVNLNQNAAKLSKNALNLNQETSNLNQDARNLGKQDAVNLNHKAPPPSPAPSSPSESSSSSPQLFRSETTAVIRVKDTPVSSTHLSIISSTISSPSKPSPTLPFSASSTPISSETTRIASVSSVSISSSIPISSPLSSTVPSASLSSSKTTRTTSPSLPTSVSISSSIPISSPLPSSTAPSTSLSSSETTRTTSPSFPTSASTSSSIPISSPLPSTVPSSLSSPTRVSFTTLISPTLSSSIHPTFTFSLSDPLPQSITVTSPSPSNLSPICIQFPIPSSRLSSCSLPSTPFSELPHGSDSPSSRSTPHPSRSRSPSAPLLTSTGKRKEKNATADAETRKEIVKSNLKNEPEKEKEDEADISTPMHVKKILQQGSSCPSTPRTSALVSPFIRRRSLPQGPETPGGIAARLAGCKSELVGRCSKLNNAVKWGAKMGMSTTLRRTWSCVRLGRLEGRKDNRLEGTTESRPSLGVSEYLMGDIDSSSSAVLNCSTASSRNKSYENLMSSDAESTAGESRSSAVEAAETGSTGVLDTSLKEPEVLTPQQIDEQLHRHEQGVEHALYRAKVWSKYAKDVIAYIEKRAQLDLDHCRALTKLAHVTRPALKDESFLPFQSIYCTALDQDIENCAQLSQTSTLLLTHKFVEPLTSRRNEHDRARKVIKETWTKELKRVTEALSNLKKAKMGYDQRHQELGRAREAAARGENTEAQDKLERKRDEALQKAKESEAWYKQCVHEANERHASLLRLKRDVLVQLRELIFQCDQTMKAVTVGYFQVQHTVAAPAPVQFQTLCESSRLYEPGSQYMEFVKRLGPSLAVEQPESPFSFQSYRPGATNQSPQHDASAANGAVSCHEDLPVGRLAGPGGSDTDSVGSSAKSMEGSPTASPLPPPRRPHTVSSGDELETDPDTDTHYPYPSRRQVMSKAAISHSFKKLITPSRCRECDSYVYFHGYECGECGLGCHKKCLETLAIKCGHKRLPRKMTTFGVDLAQHLTETNTAVPHLVVKCVAEIDARGAKIKGIYRVSGVKSRVEKLCQAFENGAHLVDLSDQHPNVIANVLKLYLRQLPEPLLTFRLYSEFIRIAKECGTGTGAEGAVRASEELRDLVGRLPKHHLACLGVLMHHLHRVATQANLNNMPPSNLGIVFGPTLLRTSEGSASLSSLVDTVHQTRAIELLILCVNEIFGHQDPLQAASGVTSNKRGDDQLRPPHGSRHVSTPVSSSSSSSSSSSVVYTVPIAGYRRSTTDSEDAHSTSQPKERKDSDAQDDDWDSESWDESAFEGVGSGVAGDITSASIPTTTTTTIMSSSSSSNIPTSCPVPPPRASPAVNRTSAGQAKIYKTSLKDYVGLEGVALHVSSGLHTAHDVVHQKLRKTVSDISSSLRSSSPAATITTTTTTTTSPAPTTATTTTTTTVVIPSPSTLEVRRGTLEDVKKVGGVEERKSMETPVRKLQQEETRRRPVLEETGRRPTIEETKTEGRSEQETSKSRQLQQASRQQVYKSESKGSVGETELKVEARVGLVSGQEQLVIAPPRKVSPLLAQRASLAQHSGTDSSLDSDHSYDFHIHTHTPSLSSAPTHRRAEVGFSATTRSFSSSRDASLDNLTSSVTSSDSSSQELDSAHVTEDSHSSEAPDDSHALGHALAYSSGCGGSSGGESGYVSPYLGSGPSPGPLVVGPSVLVTRATIAQYDKRRTITTVLAPRTSFDENRVRIQVPPAPGRLTGGSGSSGSVVTVGLDEGEHLTLSQPASPTRTAQNPPSSPTRLLQPHTQSPGPPVASSVAVPGSRPPSSQSQHQHPRRPSPNRSPRFV